MSQVQAVLISRKKKNRKEARSWLIKNKFYPIKKVHITKNFYRYRINNPKKYKRLRFKKLNEFVSLIIGFTK